MAVTSKLHEFPVEMIKAVASQLDKNDLLSFRDVCRKWNLASEDVFLEACFSKRSHLFSKYGLEMLQLISREPRLAKEVKEIKIVTQTALHPELKRGYFYSNGYKGMLSERKCEEFLFDQGKTLFLEALSNLAKNGSPISIAISNQLSEPTYGWRKYIRMIGLEHAQEGADYVTDPWCSYEVAELALTALAKSEICVSGLELLYDAKPFCAFRRGFGSLEVLTRPPPPILSLPHLRVLKLGVNLEFKPDHFGIRLGETLRSVTNLQELSLSGLGPAGKCYKILALFGFNAFTSFNEFSNPYHFPNIRKLELDQMDLSDGGSPCAIDFLRAYSTSLRHLRLVKLSEWGVEEWANFIEDLAQFPNLEQIDLSSLLTLDRADLHVAIEEVTITGDCSPGSVGGNDIAAALKRFAEGLRERSLAEAEAEADVDKDAEGHDDEESENDD